MERNQRQPSAECANLKGCGNLDDKALTFLNDLTKLHTLNLSRIKGIYSFFIGVYHDPSLELFSEGYYNYYAAPSLELLHLGKCERLQSIRCYGSKLKVIKASHNPALTTIGLNTPHLKLLDLRNNQSLKLETVLDLARKHTSLQELNIEHCEKMPIKSLKMPLHERYINKLLGHLKKEKNPDNQYHIGYIYHFGQGVKVDYEEALKWYHKAAKQGNANAYNDIGYMYGMGQGLKQDHMEALKYFQLGADKGGASCLECIAHMYHHGNGVPKDLEKAKEYYEKAAGAGKVGSYYKIGGMHEYGQGVPQDYGQALICYEKAAKNENDWLSSLIQYKIAYLYDRGLGVLKKPAQAQEHYKKTYEISAQQTAEGNTVAYRILGDLYLRGKGDVKDPKKAFEWFEKASVAQEPGAQAFLGRCYKEGWGTKPNLQLAHLWIEKLANNNFALGSYNLALLYRDGEGVERDDQKAIELFEKAIQHFDPDAFYSLGWMYEMGRGAPKNLEKAKYYYEEGAKRHAEDALYSIGRIYEYGLGGEVRDLLKAHEWYNRAADLGYEMAFDKKVLK